MKKIYFVLLLISTLFGCQKEEEFDISKTEKLNAKTNNPVGLTYRVPVVFHYVAFNNNKLPSKKELESIVQHININFQFQNTNRFTIEDQFVAISANPNIEFYLATEEENQQKGFVSIKTKYPRVSERSISNDLIRTVKEFQSHKIVTDGRKFLNVIITDLPHLTSGLVVTDNDQRDENKITLPPPYDHIYLKGETFDRSSLLSGIFIDYKSFNTDRLSIEVITHEIGHWLGLKHIFGMTSMPFNERDNKVILNQVKRTAQEDKYFIALHDDGIDDTPWTHISCDNLGVKVNGKVINAQNYMNYTKKLERVMFTKGQVEKMRKTLEEWL
ncbi:hypothetical protein EI427_03415 [Flammeovirga pectinis]|uniref:Peptidase M43 pregnancy-associated plasma-A domain-containing protein n=1 Tax=Flammeovirga pectinis TaxID=2494373 RepID=A0A3Q9FM15_9BACT|nr:M43 family zinc metalloprotease [Flammeovirga pectinis]AZQ61304.1 hypothetical protein EI427_03415 [Flammeovirga pectinis]